MAEPAAYLDGLAGLADGEVQMIMRDNTLGLLGLAAQVGAS